MLIVVAPSKVDPVRVMVTQPQAYSYAVLITTTKNDIIDHWSHIKLNSYTKQPIFHSLRIIFLLF